MTKHAPPLRKLAKVAVVAALATYAICLLLSPPNKVMGVDLSWQQLAPFLQAVGGFMLWQQIKVLAIYFTLWLWLLATIYVATLWLRPMKVSQVTSIAVGIWLLLAWSSFGRNPQLYQEALERGLPGFSYYLVIAFDWLSPHLLYHTSWLIIIAISVVAAARLVWQWRDRLPTVPLQSNKKHVIRYGTITGILVVVASVAFAWPNQANRKGKLHLWLGIDSLRYTELNSGVMPHLQKVAAQGILSRDHHAPLPRTFPAFASMLTGKPPGKTGIRHMFPDEADLEKFRSHENIVTYLKKKGWRTAVVGDYAADFVARLELPWHKEKAPRLNMHEVIRFQTLKSQIGLLPFIANYYGRKVFPALKELAEFSVAEYLAEDVIQVLEEEHDTDKDLYLLVFMGSAHFPYSPPWPYYADFRREGYKGQYLFKKFIDPYGKHEPDSSDREQIRQLFAASLRSTDDAVAYLWRYLEQEGWLTRSLVYVFGDHGENLYEQLGDGNAYQGHGEHLRGDNVLKSPWLIYAGERMREGFTAWADWQQQLEHTSQLDMFATSIELLEGTDKSLALQTDGLPLSQLVTASGRERARLAETGIWFSKHGEFSFQKQRIMYPNITDISQVDQDGHIVLSPSYRSAIETAKFRSMDFRRGGRDYRLVYRPNQVAARFEVFERRPDNDFAVLGCRQRPGLCNAAIARFWRELTAQGYYRHGDRVFY